ncbi:hypothetical protein D3C80_2054710 [compost metagenome]
MHCHALPGRRHPTLQHQAQRTGSPSLITRIGTHLRVVAHVGVVTAGNRALASSACTDLIGVGVIHTAEITHLVSIFIAIP